MSTDRLIRISGALALLSALFIVVDKVLPDSFLVSTIGLLAAPIGLFLLTAIYLLQRPGAGLAGDIGYVLNTTGLALMVGVSYVFNYAFPEMDTAAREAFLGGSGLIVVQVSYAIYTLGVAVFGISIIMAGRFPRWAALLYMVGFMGGFIRFVLWLPQIVDTISSVVAAVGIVGLGVALWRWDATVTSPDG